MTRIILFDPIIVRVANKGGSKVMLNKKCVSGYRASLHNRHLHSFEQVPSKEHEVAD